MASVTSKVRATQSEHDRWHKIAELSAMSFNSWARRALNEQAALDEALRRQEDDE